MNWKYEDGCIACTDDRGELLAEITYERAANGDIIIDHTYVQPALRRQGMADKLMTAVAGYLRQEGLKASATCSYANYWLKRHKKTYPDIIAEDMEGQAVACKITGRR